jgi:peptide chain release factor
MPLPAVYRLPPTLKLYSMTLFGPVSPDKSSALAARMARLGLREDDIDETFIRSSGPGGQNVNKVSTCVRLLHRPSSIQVKMQRERSQAINRYLARVRLCEVLESKVLGMKTEAEQRREKIRRQKRRRSKRAREKMLSAKHMRAERKQERRRPGEEG